jgi:hypothetical protein
VKDGVGVGRGAEDAKDDSEAVGSGVVGGSVEIAVRALKNAAVGTPTVGCAAGEGVENGVGAAGSELEDGAVVAGAASFGGSVEVAVAGLGEVLIDGICAGIRAGDSGECDEDGLDGGDEGMGGFFVERIGGVGFVRLRWASGVGESLGGGELFGVGGENFWRGRE